MNRFEAWLATTDFGVTVKEFPQGTRTASDAARAVGCELGQIVKSLVFMAGASPVIALMSGPNRLDEASLAALVGGPVSKADAETARVATGYSIGGVPLSATRPRCRCSWTATCLHTRPSGRQRGGPTRYSRLHPSDCGN